MFASEAVEILRSRHQALFEDLPNRSIPPRKLGQADLTTEIVRRLDLIHTQVQRTVEANVNNVHLAVEQLARWMDDRAIVRVLGAGRARLAAAIPANRLAHGGARVYLQDAIVPMPHSLHGGGIIAASASGRTPSVISALSQAREKNKDIRIIGLAAADASQFASCCSIFIGLVEVASRDSLSALADIEEYSISELLDALVVAAGRTLGYTDATWRLGHEDLGPATGPYDYILNS